MATAFHGRIHRDHKSSDSGDANKILFKRHIYLHSRFFKYFFEIGLKFNDSVGEWTPASVLRAAEVLQN